MSSIRTVYNVCGLRVYQKTLLRTFPEAHVVTSASARILTPDERSILRSLVLTMCIIAFPSKYLYLIAPPLFVTVMMWRGLFVSPTRLITLCISLLSFATLSLIIDYQAAVGVSFFGMFFWFLTHMPILIVLSVKRTFRVSLRLMDRLVSFVAIFVLIQSAACLISLILLLQTGVLNGDYVSGTFGILDWFGEPTINHVFFTLCMFSALVFLWGFRDRFLVKLALGLGMIVTILAQSGHQTFFFVIALLVATFAGHHAPHRLLSAVLGVCVTSSIVIGVMVLAFPNTFDVASMWYEKVVFTEDSPKRMVVEAALGLLCEPKIALFGAGLGQFSSRAALFAGGWYAPAQVPNILIFMTERTERYLVPALLRHEIVGEGSAIAQPMFSYISFSIEAGLLLTLAFLYVVSRLVYTAILHTRIGSAERAHYGRYTIFFVSFLGLSCSIENYLEFTQGLFLPLILLVVGMARARTIAESAA